MKLPLAYYGDPILRRKADPITSFDNELEALVKDMDETMRSLDGLGLAAPQVKKSLRLFLINIPEENEKGEHLPTETIVFINPTLLSLSKETGLENEGCLSIPKLYGEVTRPLKIEVEAFDVKGNRFTGTYTDWAARAILHENDHINGVLFIDRMEAKKRKALEAPLQKIKKLYS